jgi:hypothetical protein
MGLKFITRACLNHERLPLDGRRIPVCAAEGLKQLVDLQWQARKRQETLRNAERLLIWKERVNERARGFW